MTALLIILGILLLLGVMPVGVRAVFDGSLSVYLTFFHAPLRIYPGKKKGEKPKKNGKKEPTEQKKKSGGDLSQLNEYLRLITRLLGKLRRKLLIRELTLHAIFGGSDPALNYGRAWAAIGTVMPVLEQLFRIRKHDVGAYCSEEESAIRIYVRAHTTITVAYLLSIAVHALRGYLKIKHNKPEKAVQSNDQSH